MVKVNFNIWGKDRIVQSTPSTLGIDASALRSANPVGLLDISEPFGTNPEQNTYVITHGYLNQGGNTSNLVTTTGGNPNNQFKPEDWMSKMADALRKKEPNANIILVDWEDGAKPGLPLIAYGQAATNTKEVGEQLAQYLKARNLDPNKTELIGHSLGAHVSGFAGAKYKELTGKELNGITGLDPAGPNFETRNTGNFRTVLIPGPSPGSFTSVEVLEQEPVPPSDRLDPDDAKRVIAIHTSKTLGHDGAIGDFDVFINWNNFNQPGKFTLADNHGYANELYTNLIKGTVFPQSDGKLLNLNRLNSTETGKIDVDTTKALFAGSTSGTFDNDENKKTLGTPADGDSESYVQFDDSEFTTATDINFNLGNLTYRNGITLESSTPKGDFPLDITLSLTNPVPNTQTFNFPFNLTATENTGDPVKDADILRFSDAGISQESFKFQGSDYKLKLVGFSADSGRTTLGRFNTPEQQFSNAQLIGKVIPTTFLVTDAIELSEKVGNKIGETTDEFNTRVANFSKGFLDGLYAGVSSVLFPPQRVAQNLQASAEQNSTFQITEEVMAQYPGGLLGTESNDNIIGSPATDIVLAAEGADTIEGASGGDYLLGLKGNDRILGDDGNDILNGNEGDDFILGGVDDDLVRGGKANDQIFGDDGEDILIADRGTDRLTGGSGSDIFILRTDTGIEETNAATADSILDFNASEGDLIGINGGVPIDILTFTPTDVNQDGIADTIIQYTETNEIFGVYTNIFGVVINTQPDIVKNALFTIPLNDPIIQIG
ncbi:Lipoprotein lipase [Planktothrix agardhii]|uniref:choice-of-anchor K domain-containing protein n=1 Tax=Planktothrix agardhii TaxID=1160 RepID=UPI0020A76B0A|nr:choice-of-anchor K domain-containing protein [Planktothrix agardhii]CAD5964516.1 Lipoprotein lipase [Planktothrix agardhii]